MISLWPSDQQASGGGGGGQTIIGVIITIVMALGGLVVIVYFFAGPAVPPSPKPSKSVMCIYSSTMSFTVIKITDLLVIPHVHALQKLRYRLHTKIGMKMLPHWSYQM